MAGYSGDGIHASEPLSRTDPEQYFRMTTSLAMAHYNQTILPNRITAHSDTDWETHKSAVHTKYMLEGKSTQQVRMEMEQVGFFARYVCTQINA